MPPEAMLLSQLVKTLKADKMLIVYRKANGGVTVTQYKLHPTDVIGMGEFAKVHGLNQMGKIEDRNAWTPPDAQ